MQAEYLYGIVIVIILLVLLFVYNIMKSTPDPTDASQNAGADTTKKTPPTTMTINYNLPGGALNGTLTFSVINSKTLKSSFSIPYEPNVSFIGIAGSSNGSTIPLYYIQYDGNGLNLILVPNSSANQLDRYCLKQLSNYNISVTDSNTSHPFYNTNTATVNGSVLTLTNGTDKLSITLPTAFV